MVGWLVPTLYLAAGTAVAYALCWAFARLVARIFGVRSPGWRAALPWASFQLYLVVGLMVGGPPHAGGLALAAAVMGVVTVGASRIRRGPGAGLRPLVLAWAVPWAAAAVWTLL